MKHAQRLVLIASLVLCPPLALAMHTIAWYPAATLSGGAAFIGNAGRSQIFPIVNPDTDSFYQYHARHWNQSEFLGGVFLGAEFRFNQRYEVQLGLSYYQPATFNAKGTVTQGADLISANQYFYHYMIRSRQLFAETKLLYNWYPCIHPYASLGLGAAFNYALNYHVNIVPPFTAFSNQFTHHHTTSFAYSLGLGMDVDMTRNIRFGIGYRFADLGKIKLGNATIDTLQTSNSLSQANVYANEVMLQLTYIYYQ